MMLEPFEERRVTLLDEDPDCTCKPTFIDRLLCRIRRSRVSMLTHLLASELSATHRAAMLRVILDAPYTDHTRRAMYVAANDPDPLVREELVRVLHRTGRLYDVVPLLVHLSADKSSRIAWLSRVVLTNRTEDALPHAVNLTLECAKSYYLRCKTHWDKAIAFHLRAQAQVPVLPERARANLYTVADLIDAVCESLHNTATHPC